MAILKVPRNLDRPVLIPNRRKPYCVPQMDAWITERCDVICVYILGSVQCDRQSICTVIARKERIASFT